MWIVTQPQVEPHIQPPQCNSLSQLHQPAEPWPSSHVFQVIWHLHGILPTKPKITETLPTIIQKIPQKKAGSPLHLWEHHMSWTSDWCSRTKPITCQSLYGGQTAQIYLWSHTMTSPNVSEELEIFRRFWRGFGMQMRMFACWVGAHVIVINTQGSECKTLKSI